MKEFYSANEGMKTRRNPGRSIAVGSTNVRYGKDDNARKLFDDVIQEKDKKQLKKKAKILIDALEKNSENNGFFKLDEGIEINVGAGSDNGPKIKIDDVNIYKLFFELYSTIKNNNPEMRDGVIHKIAVERTINAYFGEFKGDVNLRKTLTESKFDLDKFIEDPNYKQEIPSISKLQGKNCAMCVERASVAHNLWLLGGYESYYIDASSIELADCDDKAHAYCMVNYNGTFKLFDCSMGIYHRFEESINPVEDILNGEPLVIDHSGKQYIYANAYALENTHTTTK